MSPGIITLLTSRVAALKLLGLSGTSWWSAVLEVKIWNRPGELLHHQVEQVGLVQLFQKFVEAEMLEDVPCIGAEAADVGIQVVQDLGLAEVGQIHGRGVVEGQLGSLLQEGI